MEEEKLKNFNCKTDYDTCFSYVLFFNGKTGPKKEKLTPNEQNNVIRKKLIDTAHRIGYSPTVMSGIRDIINSIDFATQPSLLNYQKKSAGDLQKKLWYTKSRINHYLANERVESKHNLKTAEAQEAAPFNFVSNPRILARVCLSTEDNASLAIHDLIVKQALDQGLTQDDLYKTVSVIAVGKPPATRRIPVNPPQKLIDVVTDTVQKQVQNISNRITSKEQLLALAHSAAGEKHGLNKLRIMCYLKSCPLEEFKSLVNEPVIKYLFGERELAKMVDSRKKDAAQMDVVESGKQVEDKLEGKEDGKENDESPLTDDELEKLALYGIEVGDLTPSGVRQLLEETEALLMSSGLIPSLRPH